MLIGVLDQMRAKNSLFGDLNKYLKVELNLLDQLLLKNGCRFRNDKGFKDAKMTSKNWKKFQSIMLTDSLRIFFESLPLLSDLKRNRRENVFLPTVQMLQYVLVRLRGSFHQVF